jgi:hypothetical protein
VSYFVRGKVYGEYPDPELLPRPDDAVAILGISGGSARRYSLTDERYVAVAFW